MCIIGRDLTSRSTRLTIAAFAAFAAAVLESALLTDIAILAVRPAPLRASSAFERPPSARARVLRRNTVMS